MSEILDKLIEEMFTPCHVCQGCATNIEDEDKYDKPCDHCDGTGEVLCFEAELLRQILKDGRR